MKTILSSLLIVLSCAFAQAQYHVAGKVIDAGDGQSMPSATVTIANIGAKPHGQSTDPDGRYEFKNMPKGKYVISVSFIGYSPMTKNIEITDADVTVPTIRLKPDNKNIDEVKVAATLTRQEQRGDTSVYNAAAFKVNPDATTEDLLKKMPGITVENGNVKAQGENVKRVLVDGKEFFGSDPSIALKNISADMVDKIEVYDRDNDQAKFTGFSDGNEEKTINIMTKMGISKGRFGKVYAGYGSNDRYEAGGNINLFSGDKRISFVGSANNINSRDFNSNDIMNVMSGSGINTIGSLGVNVANQWGEKAKLEASYFYNRMKNKNDANSTREYYLESDDDSLRIYNDSDIARSTNNNHQISVRSSCEIDSLNSLIFNLSSGWQGNDRTSTSSGADYYNGNYFAIDSMHNNNDNSGVSLRADLTWRHRLAKPLRTFSVRVNTSLTNTDADGNTFKLNEYHYKPQNNVIAHQQNNTDNSSYQIGASIVYTEPIVENISAMINYSPTFTYSSGDKQVFADTVVTKNDLPSNYIFSPTLSNKKTTEYQQHKGGLGLNIRMGNNARATLQVDLQNSNLRGEQEYPMAFSTNRTFFNVMPSFNFRMGRRQDGTMVRVRYRTNTNAPSVAQMQDVVDVSNTRRYSSGNSALNEQYTHSLMFHIMKSNTKTSHTLFAMGRATITKNYIATSSTIANNDSTLVEYNNIVLPQGTQFDRPVNLNGYYSLDARLNYGLPVNWLGSNVNFGLNANMSTIPSLYNGIKSKNNTYKLNGDITIGSSFSENVDFTLSYNGGYNILRSDASMTSNYNYYSHSLSLNTNFIILNRIVFNNSLSHQMTDGMGKEFDNSYLMWNAALGCKFLAGNRAELRLKVYDILDVNKSVSRNLSTTYVQTTNSTVLQRYLMLTFTYKLKSIGQQTNKPYDRRMGPPPGGMRGGFGGGPGGHGGPSM